MKGTCSLVPQNILTRSPVPQNKQTLSYFPYFPLIVHLFLFPKPHRRAPREGGYSVNSYIGRLIDCVFFFFFFGGGVITKLDYM